MKKIYIQKQCKYIYEEGVVSSDLVVIDWVNGGGIIIRGSRSDNVKIKSIYNYHGRGGSCWC